MKVGIVVPGGVDPSGEERTIPVVRALVARLARRHDVRVLAVNQPGAPARWTLDGARVVRPTRPRTLPAARQLGREHRREPFDVLHAFWAGTPGAIAAWVGQRGGVPVLVHVAGGELARLDDVGYGEARTWRGRLTARYALRHAAIVTAATAPMCLAVRPWASRVERVPLGVDTTRWTICPPRGRRAGPARLAWIGSINRVKAPGVLVATLAELVRRGVDFTIDIVGEDTLDGALQARIATLGLAARARFRGFLRQVELHTILRTVDILLHTSWHEAGPVVALEAALVGVPTVGTAVGHIAEWSSHAAVAVPLGDAGGLAHGVQALIEDEPRRLALARAAQARAAAEDADWTAGRFETLYRDATGQ